MFSNKNKISLRKLVLKCLEENGPLDTMRLAAFCEKFICQTRARRKYLSSRRVRKEEEDTKNLNYQISKGVRIIVSETASRLVKDNLLEKTGMTEDTNSVGRRLIIWGIKKPQPLPPVKQKVISVGIKISQEQANATT